MRVISQRLLTGVARAGLRHSKGPNWVRNVLQRLLTGVASAGHVLIYKGVFLNNLETKVI
jgi:hypothetical protein